MEAAFRVLRPVCTQLTKEKSSENVRMLTSVVNSVDTSTLQNLQEYVLFPLMMILKSNEKIESGLCEDIVECINAILSKVKVTKWDLMKDIFTHLCVSLNAPQTLQQVVEASEELKLSIIQCMMSLLKSSSDNVLLNLYEEKQMGILGHAVSSFLKLAESEKHRQLRTLSMLCLQQLAQAKGQGKLREAASSTFASFLPGICISLCRICTGDAKQGQGVTTCAIELWEGVVALVLADSCLPPSDKPLEALLGRREAASGSAAGNGSRGTSQGSAGSQGAERSSSLAVEKSEHWIQSTGDKVGVLVKRATGLRSHQSWKVRLALVKFTQTLLLNCTRSLSGSVSPLLEVVVGLLGDPYPEVAFRCRQVVSQFSDHIQANTHSRTLVSIIEESTFKLLTSLPRVMRSSSDQVRLTALKTLTGYIVLLGPQVSTMLYSASHLQRLATALVQILELDVSNIKILEEKTPIPGAPSSSAPPSSDGHHNPLVYPVEFYHMYTRRKKTFQHFHDDDIYQELTKICALLGYYGDVELLADKFTDLFHQSSLYSKQALLILNLVLLGTIGEGLEALGIQKRTHQANGSHIVKALLEEYISSDNWHLATSNQSDLDTKGQRPRQSDWLMVTRESEAQSLSVKVLNSNILFICLLLEGIGGFAKVLGSDFNIMLMDALYPVMEKLGDESAIISCTAYNTLVDVCSCCNYRSVAALIYKNADYLVNSISLGLRHLELNSRAPLVLKVMIQYSHLKILPLVEVTIEEILSTLDQHHLEDARRFMEVLHVLVLAIGHWFPGPEQPQGPTQAPSNCQSTPGDLRKCLLDYIEKKKVGDGECEEEGGVDDTEASVPPEEDEYYTPDEKPALPLNVSIVIKVLERCKHLMSSRSPRLRLLVLDTVLNGIRALRHAQYQLLPVAHQLWPGLIHRFVDQEQLVTVKAFETLCVMGNCCGDFIRKRTVKDLWPKITEFLEKQARLSLRPSPIYKQSVTYKQQLSVLRGVGQLCFQLQVSERECAMIADACMPYLSQKQPGPLQEAALAVFRVLIELHVDSMWLTLSNVYCPQPLMDPPHHCFPTIKLSGIVADQKNEYAANISQLLSVL